MSQDMDSFYANTMRAEDDRDAAIRERDEAEAAVSRYEDTINERDRQLDEADRLRAENERLRGALRDIASYALDSSDGSNHQSDVEEMENRFVQIYDDANAALAAKGDEHE